MLQVQLISRLAEWYTLSKDRSSIRQLQEALSGGARGSAMLPTKSSILDWIGHWHANLYHAPAVSPPSTDEASGLVASGATDDLCCFGATVTVEPLLLPVCPIGS